MPFLSVESAEPPPMGGMRDRVRHSRLGVPLVVLWRALRGLPLATDGDSAQQQRVAKAVTAVAYNSLSRWLERSNTDFMNYGYRPAEAPEAAANGDAAANGSVPDDYYCVNLYRRVAGAVELRGKDVLEVGCGRGGGAALVARDLRAASMVGVDLSPGAISHCRDAHREPNLRFFEADAEDLPFTAGSFDAVINVESSHCYPNMRRFLDEVHRVLRPDGVMLFADVRAPDELPALREHVSAAGFSVLEEERMTPGVVRALELDNDRRVRILDSVPRPWRVVARNFIGAESGDIFASLQSGQLEYIRFALRREATPPAASADSAAAATTANAVAQG